MASYDNLMAAEQPWAYRPSFSDAWISDIYSKETDTLTKALQMSFSAASSDGDAGGFSPVSMVDSLFFDSDQAAPPPPLQTPTASGLSENDIPAAAVSKPRRGVPPSGGRVAKRKSRASKRTATTFITADAANFRQMVQQVTGVRFDGFSGVRFDGLSAAAAGVLKPEPQRAFDSIQMGGGLPTFDTSAFFLDGSASTMTAQPATAADGKGIELDSYYSFPTLESYVVN